MDSTRGKLKKVLYISLGVLVIVVLMVKHTPSGPSNMGSAFTALGLFIGIIIVVVLGGFAGSSVIRGNAVTKLSWGVVTVLVGFLVIIVLLFIVGFFSDIYVKCCGYHRPYDPVYYVKPINNDIPQKIK